MLISLLTFLLISNALTLRKDKSILFSRIVMVSLILASFYPRKVNFKPQNTILSSSLSINISILILLFISNELFKVANIYFFIINNDA